MNIEQTAKDECTLLKLTGPITIENAEVLHQEILFAMADSKELVLDLRAVTECDMAAFQIFYAARLSAQNEGKHFKVVDPSDEVMNMLETAGLSHTAIFEEIDSNGKAV